MGTRERGARLKEEINSKNLERVMITWILNNPCRNKKKLGRAGLEDKPSFRT